MQEWADVWHGDLKLETSLNNNCSWRRYITLKLLGILTVHLFLFRKEYIVNFFLSSAEIAGRHPLVSVQQEVILHRWRSTYLLLTKPNSRHIYIDDVQLNSELELLRRFCSPLWYCRFRIA